MFLTLIHTRPWGLAALLATAASFLNGLASVEIRRNAAPKYALTALILAEITEMLCIATLSPTLVTSIAGFGMVVVISYCDPENPTWNVRIAACLITLSVIVIALDLHLNGGTTSVRPDLGIQYIFWSVCATLTVISAISTVFPHYHVARIYLMIGSGIQAVISISLSYAIMIGGNVHLIPLLIVNAAYEMFIMTTSLKANPLYKHLPISYAVWQGGVWLSAPALQSKVYHGTGASAFGVVCALLASIFIVMRPTESKSQ